MWRTVDPEGHVVVMTEAAWAHILDSHGELASDLPAIMRAVSFPTLTLRRRGPNEVWFLLAGAGPSRCLQVVVHYREGHGSITTAFGRRRLP